MSASATRRILHWSAPPLSAGLVLLLLLGSVGAGLRVPGLTSLERLPALGLLDYRTLSGGAYLPLRADYVDALLGTTSASGAGSAPTPAGPADPAREVLSDEPAAPSRAEPGPASMPVVASPALERAFTNDDFDQAVDVRRLPFSARTTTTQATREPDEPTSCASTGGTAWYRYTAKDDRPLVADSFGSDHAVSIGVFEGEHVADLRMQTCSTSPAGDAEVSLSPKDGTTYHFQITGVVSGGTTFFRLRGLGTLTQVSKPPQGPLWNSSAGFAGVSGDGRFAVFSESCRVWVVDRRSQDRQIASKTSFDQPACGRYPFISANGRFVGFASVEPLVEDDRNGGMDLFLHDRVTDTTTRVSVASDGREGQEEENELNATFGALSADGRYVVFSSPLNGLVAADENGESDIFVHDRRTGRTTLESVDRRGRPTGHEGLFPSISDDGRFVVFGSQSNQLAEADYTSQSVPFERVNVFRRDRLNATTRIVSVTPDGVADNQGFRSAISADGQIVAWTSTADHLVPDDTNGISDVFLRDMRKPDIQRVSVSTKGEQQLDSSLSPRADNFQLAASGRYVSLSGDGRYVAFDSRAANLVAGDANGASDVFVHDRVPGTTLRVSVTTTGQEGDGDSSRPRISRDGQVVGFESLAPRFTGSTPDRTEVFVHDRNGT